MPNGWEAMVNELVNKYDLASNSHKLKNITKFAAIYSLNGECYASHPASFKLL